MNPQTLDAAVTFMRHHWNLITGDESAYKPDIAKGVQPVFEAAAAGDSAWPQLLKKTSEKWKQQIGWRSAAAFVDYARAYPDELGRAVKAMTEPSDADLFWDTALAPVGGRDGLRNGYAQLYAPGARAALASLVLFSRDHESHPIYRARNSGKPLAALLGEPLDKRSLGTTLDSYYEGLARLGRLLKERGLDVRHNLDVQGVLWVVNYNHVV